MNFSIYIEQVYPYMVERRRYYHTWPELSDQEEKTVASIAEELEKMGIEQVTVPGGGVLGFIHGKPGGRTVLLRADVDGLPVAEDPENLRQKKVCVSCVPGVSMACGHDVHIAMLLGTGKILSQQRDSLPGDVILMFERGEEGTFNVGHLHQYMCDHNLKPDTCWGMHVYAPLETGKIYIQPGPVMAGVIRLQVRLIGKGGHGARPDRANSPIDCFATLYNEIAKLKSRWLSPFSPLTYSIGCVNAGTTGNVIPGELSFAGTIRFFDRNHGRAFGEEIEKIIRHTAQIYGCRAEVSVSNPCFPVENDMECAQLARRAISDCVGGPELADTEPWMVSESFCLSAKLWPGVFALLGVRNDELGSGAENHNAKFDVDEEAMKYGVLATLSYTYAFLGSGYSAESRKWNGTLRQLYQDAGVPFLPELRS